MTALHNSLYAAAFVSCLVLLLGLRGGAPENRRRSTWLFVLLLLLSMNFGAEWLMSNPESPAKSLWLALVMGIALLLGPCLWLYALSLTRDSPPRLREFSAWHLLPIVVGLLLLLPLTGKIHGGSSFVHPDTVLPMRQPTLVHSTMLASILVFALQAAWYLNASWRLLRRQTRAARSLFADPKDRELNALRVAIWVVGAHWVMGMARALHCLLLGKDAGYVVLLAMAEVMFSFWAAILLMRSGQSVRPEDRRLANELDKEAPAAKYARSALDAAARERIQRKLDLARAQHRLHLDSRISLRSLCAHLRENPHYVSQVINQDLGTSFHDLVNRWRIDEAKEMLVRQPERSVLDVAVDVGFNSKSTFNAAFRQHVGTTPTAFRREGAPASAPMTSDPAG